MGTPMKKPLVLGEGMSKFRGRDAVLEAQPLFF